MNVEKYNIRFSYYSNTFSIAKNMCNFEKAIAKQSRIEKKK